MLHSLGRWAANPTVALIIVSAAALWVLCSAIFGFPNRWATVFQSMVAALTVAMVFIIQHTQAREQAATQRKLDEILRALPGADNAMITLEEAPDKELLAAANTHRELRDEASTDLRDTVV
jgi:low affinity Fe/Cu permease